MSSLRLLSHSVLAASALMGVAPPALAADAVNPAASAPIAAGDTLLPATVLRDNLWTLAARVQHDPGITRQQVMVAMLRRNPNAFLQGNMHRLRRDVALVVPTAQEIAAENAGAAEAVVAAHLQALEQGTAVVPLAPVTGAPAAAASAAATSAPAALPASAARAAQTAQTEKPPAAPAAKPSAAVAPTPSATPAAPPQAPAKPTPPAEAPAKPTPPAEAPAPAASAVATAPATGTVIQAPAEVPAVVTPTPPAPPAVPPASTPLPGVSAAASAGAQPPAGQGSGSAADLSWWPALAAVALLGAAGVVWMRRRPGAAVADTAAPSSFFDENGVRRQSRPKLIDVSQAGVETARTVETLQAAAQMVQGGEAGQAPALSPDDPYREATIKLEIARTNLELGRVEVAKAMLQAVRREGSAAQQLLAGDLLHSLSPT